MLLLSSIKRLQLYTGLSDAPEDKRALAQFLGSVSVVIQNFLNRDFELKQRTEYFDTQTGVLEYFPKSFPIISLDEIKTDVTGLYAGNEIAESNYYIGQYARSFVLWRSLWAWPKGMRVKYTGGVATHPVNSVYILINNGSQPFKVGNYVKTDSEAGVGLVKAYNDTTKQITIENYYGVFLKGDVLTQQDKEFGDNEDNVVGTIDTIVSQSLVDTLPAIGTAIEMEIRFLQKNKGGFEKTNVGKDGNTSFRLMDHVVYGLQPETKLFLSEEAGGICL